MMPSSLSYAFSPYTTLFRSLFRYRARNFPESLNAEEHARWLAFCQRRLSDPSAGASVTWTELAQRLATLRAGSLDERQRHILDDVERYGREQLERFGVPIESSSTSRSEERRVGQGAAP